MFWISELISYNELTIQPNISSRKKVPMFVYLKNFAEDESGATAIEYGLIAALVSIAAIAALRGMGQSLSNLFGMVSGEISGAVNSAG